jgi:signal transduction histidine kinase
MSDVSHGHIDPASGINLGGGDNGREDLTTGGGGRLGTELSLTLAFIAVIGLTMTIIWAGTGARYYWPRWVWLGGLVVIAPLVVAAHVRTMAGGGRRWLVLHADIDAALSLYLLLIWSFTGVRGLWPLWPILGLSLLLATHALLLYRQRLVPLGTARQLTERVETLTRSRAEALDVQATELRRIERDLHDGVQARLVALSMQLGRAEARLADDPDTATLVKAARAEAGAAIAELRSLARGIAPPVLTDRGLAAAIQSMADRSPNKVTVRIGRLDRLAPVVESAAYFVVAEALTNVTKHAAHATAQVSLTQSDGQLVLDIADNGPGGADPAGGGLSGLRARVEALDGSFTVASPMNGPTVIHAELPCGS